MQRQVAGHLVTHFVKESTHNVCVYLDSTVEPVRLLVSTAS